MEELKYPIGKVQFKDVNTLADIQNWIQDLKALPTQMRRAVEGLSEEQLDTPYREGGWTVRQVVHHVADSHMNSFVRFKLALTEEKPTIKPYMEDLWAKHEDYKLPVDISLNLLEGLHARMVVLLENMREQDWERAFIHPEHERTFRLDNNLALYSWHGKHHVAHITKLRERKRW